MADLRRAGRLEVMCGDVLMLNGARTTERAGVRQEECGDIHRVCKKDVH